MHTFWTRINTLLLLLVLAALVSLTATLALRAEGGPLDPGAAPGSTDGIRLAGTPISSFPATINSPGNYYVTRNFTASSSSTNAITILASGVTLDLGGFQLAGTGQPGSGDGINIPDLRGDIEVRNGSIVGWSGWGISATHTVRSNFFDLRVNGNRQGGMDVASGAVIHDVTASENKIDGILVRQEGTFYSGGSVRDSHTSNNVGRGLVISADGMRIEGNVAAANGTWGIFVFGERNVIQDNTATANGQPGIWIDNTASENVVLGNISGENDQVAEVFISAGNHHGELVDHTGDAGSVIATSNPFANFIYDNP